MRGEPAGAWWTWRAVLLGPAFIQLIVARSLYTDLWGGSSSPAILVPLTVLHVAGPAGILGGVLGRSRHSLFLGLACTALGFALPIVMNAVAAPVDKDTALIPGLGRYDAEGLGAVMFLRLLIEAPFWLVYAAMAALGFFRVRLRGRSRTEPMVR